MRRVRIALTAALTAFVLVAARPAAAQTGGEFSAGWRLLNVDQETFAAGWYADLVGNLTGNIGLVGDIGGNYKNFEENDVFNGVPVRVTANLKVHTFMGGVRFTARLNPRLVPFAQALVGLAHGSASVEGSATVGGQTFSLDESESTTDAAIDLGGGVNITLSPGVSVRVGAGYFRVLEEGAGNAFRFAAGVVFPF